MKRNKNARPNVRQSKAEKASKGTFRRILGYVGKYPLSVIFLLLFSVVTVAASLYIPVLVGDAIDCIVENGVLWSELKRIFTILLVTVGVAALAQWLAGICNNKISCDVVRDLRADAFQKIGKLPLKYIDGHSHGDTVSRVVADADQFSEGLLLGFTQLVTGVLTILGTIAFMLVTNFKIGVVVVLISPLSLFAARFIATHTSKFFKGQTKTRGEQTAFVDERIAGLKTVQAFSQEDESLKAFDEINGRLEKASMQATFYSSLVNPCTRFLNNLTYALVALLGAFDVVAGIFTVGGLSKLLSYANQYTKPFNEISGVITELKGAFVCASRIFELTDEEEEVSDDGKDELGLVDGNVEFDKVDFSYDEEKKLIEDLSLSVKAGQRVAIVGRTGSGKTTLINLLMRFYDVQGGELKIEGKDVRSVTRSSLRQNFGMVLQETWLKSGTVKDNIRMGKPNATDEEVIAAAKAAHAHGFIKRMENGYDAVIGEDGGGLSEGQKQLLCIARIMISLPPMLILDEATSSIDTRTEEKISDAFAFLMKGRTSFVVAHRLSTIVGADIILVMEKGKVAERGTHQELLAKKGAYYALYNGQFE